MESEYKSQNVQVWMNQLNEKMKIDQLQETKKGHTNIECTNQLKIQCVKKIDYDNKENIPLNVKIEQMKNILIQKIGKKIQENKSLSNMSKAKAIKIIQRFFRNTIKKIRGLSALNKEKYHKDFLDHVQTNNRYLMELRISNKIIQFLDQENTLLKDSIDNLENQMEEEFSLKIQQEKQSFNQVLNQYSNFIDKLLNEKKNLVQENEELNAKLNNSGFKENDDSMLKMQINSKNLEIQKLLQEINYQSQINEELIEKQKDFDVKMQLLEQSYQEELSIQVNHQLIQLQEIQLKNDELLKIIQTLTNELDFERKQNQNEKLNQSKFFESQSLAQSCKMQKLELQLEQQVQQFLKIQQDAEIIKEKFMRSEKNLKSMEEQATDHELKLEDEIQQLKKDHQLLLEKQQKTVDIKNRHQQEVDKLKEKYKSEIDRLKKKRAEDFEIMENKLIEIVKKKDESINKLNEIIEDMKKKENSKKKSTFKL